MNSRNKNLSKDILQAATGPKLGRKKNLEIGKTPQTAAPDVQVTLADIIGSPFNIGKSLQTMHNPTVHCSGEWRLSDLETFRPGEFQTLRLFQTRRFFQTPRPFQTLRLSVFEIFNPGVLETLRPCQMCQDYMHTAHSWRIT